MRQIITSMLLLVLVAGSASAGTVAYWRFEEGPSMASVEHGDLPGGEFYPAIADESGNGYALSPWDDNMYVYRTNVAAAQMAHTGVVNQFCVKNTTGGPSMGTDPTAWISTTFSPAQWTIEATFKAEGTGSHRTLVGRDSQGAAGDAALAALYFKIEPSDAVSVAFGDVDGYWHAAVSEPDIIQGFDNPTNPDGNGIPWYSMAAVSDGATLSLYLKNVTAGGPYVLMAQTDMTTSGSADTALTVGLGSGSDWTAGTFSVTRGLWNGGHVDRAWGYIDEVRISDEALPVSQLLHSRQGAWNPTPVSGAGGVSATDATVTWQAGLNADETGVNPRIAKHLLYLQVSPTDPTWAAPVEIAPTGATESYSIGALGEDITYRWRVDEVLDDDPVDPNVLTGAIWTFSTSATPPVITEQPRGVALESGETATFTIVVDSATAAHYQWKQVDAGGDIDVGTDSDTLVIENVTSEEKYYCVVTNDSATAVTSRQAGTALKRMVAHWTLDGDYLDVSGEGHDADPNGAPTFINGATWDAATNPDDQAVDINSQSGWATAGTWDPGEYSDQMTVSFWLYWEGPIGWQSFVAKRDGDWGANNVCWQVSLYNNSNNLFFQSWEYNVFADGILQADAWQYVTATFDGETGRLYFNGELVSSGAWGFGPARDAVITLGGNSGGLEDAREFTNGALDDVRLYNYPLSELDVARLYNGLSGESVCVTSARPDAMYDYNGDCTVDLLDFGQFVSGWLDCGLVPDCN